MVRRSRSSLASARNLLIAFAVILCLIQSLPLARAQEDTDDCAAHEFSCGDNQCIPGEGECDGTEDCDNGADERNCALCEADQFECGDGTCIELDRKCDNVNDCLDGDDEENCDFRCTDDEFECQDRTMCIPRRSYCDGTVDCPDSSDESNCGLETECNIDEFRCSNGLCIPQSELCNGFQDCLDGVDEKNCRQCNAGAFHCKSSHECISAEGRCDGTQDCEDGSDELECGKRCSGFACNGQCLSKELICDGVQHCADGSDEDRYRCHNKTPQVRPPSSGACLNSEWQCDNGECIDKGFVCDGRPDCVDNSDEADDNCSTAPVCEDNQLLCDNRCLESYQLCDGHQDCSDGTDEQGCPATKAPACPELTCPDGSCYSHAQKCDGRVDCRDQSDEADCNCPSGELRCADGTCYPERGHCDGYPDCPDHSDEQGCQVATPPPTRAPTCQYNEFQCRNGQCIPNYRRCDNRPDCADHSDEYECSAPRPTPGTPVFNLKTYPNDQIIKESREVVFQCRDEGPHRSRVRWTRGPGRKLPAGSSDNNGRLEIPNIRMADAGTYYCEAEGYPTNMRGASVSVNLVVERFNRTDYVHHQGCGIHEATCMNGNCIPRSAICDGNFDCPDGSDESSCSKNYGCEPNEFKCRNNKCVLKTWRCDGQNDCVDNSDEENCEVSSPDAPCRYDEFQCRSGQCIPKTYQCDSQSDCLDNSDEIGCTKPTVIQPPPARVNLKVGYVFNITCVAVGFPVPLVTWRLNWNNVPEKCVQTSVNGVGTLTCADIQVRDSGAYSCEILNSVGSQIVSPDTILVVEGEDVCHSGSFNSKASRPEECLSCFCFGVSNQCSSADLFIYALPPPVTSLNVVGVQGPWGGEREITVGEFKEHDLIATRHGVQLRLSDIPLSDQLPYYALPENYHGNQLKSYGGYFKYNVEYTGHGSPNDAPDVIIIGNEYTLSHRSNNRLESGRLHQMSVQFVPGLWYKSNGDLATREELMMTLANMAHVLIKLQYVDRVQREIELTNIEMDSAAVSDRGLGSAHLVEECRCPAGYSGLSCEECAHGYVRQRSGSWLGRCVREEPVCYPGTYGDPSRGIPCRPCPCPSTSPSNNFASTCRLGPNGPDDVICDCNRGYTGRRCEVCDRGYVGNPMAPGDYCKPAPEPSPCNPDGTEEAYDGYCKCKPNVVGPRCDQCAPNTFHLNRYSHSGCTDCFCMGMTRECQSSSLYRETIHSSMQEAYGFITNYDAPEPSRDTPYKSPEAREIVFRNSRPDDTETYYWSLPNEFVGNKLTAYGGYLNYTLRYTPLPSASMSKNSGPDVVIKSENDITILHFRRDDVPRGTSTYSVPIIESAWQRQDGEPVNREHLLMALAQVSFIFVKATYTSLTEEAALSHVSMDIATDRNSVYNTVRAVEVEQCFCPAGHTGLSCETCSPGYKRSSSGVYLNICEPCECNGHSDTCDPETGKCENCLHGTEGDNCEFCIRGGNATHGTPYDCESESLTGCEHCDGRGTVGCAENRCTCKANVEGSQCNECRRGTFNLNSQNPLGCSECFCSGVSTQCQPGHFYREELPMNIFDENFAVVNRDNGDEKRDINTDFARNRLSYVNEYGDRDLYWRLPPTFLGKQLNSYGANLTFSIESIGSGGFRGDDVIIRGNGLTLTWERNGEKPDSHVDVVPLIEGEWRNVQRNGVHMATRHDILTVLSNVESILIRATLHEETSEMSIGDIILGTAVTTNSGAPRTSDIEVCQCPEGYTGNSCETCAPMYYRDVDDRSVDRSGSCRRCPCSSNAESCELNSSRAVVCHCKPNFYGARCEDSTDRPYPPPPVPGEPTISVTISANLLQIIEVGQTVRINCTGRHIISNAPLSTRWFKLHGHFSNRVYENRGMLVITNTQIDDSGVYVCQGQSGNEVVEERVSINIGDQPSRPTVRISPQVVHAEEGGFVEVVCEASGSPAPEVYWQRVDGGRFPDDVRPDTRELRFNYIRKSDEGQYRCTAQNPHGNAYDMVSVYVREGSVTERPTPSPSVHINPDYYNGRPGDEVRLHCSSNELGSSAITWSKDRTPSLPQYIIISGDGLLIIRSANTEDSGRYICTVTTYLGVTITSSVEVHINGGSVPTEHPRIVPIQTNHLVVQGSDFSLPCLTTGYPEPRVKWTKLHETFDVNTRQVGNTLVISVAQVSNRGVYICAAENDDGIVDQASTIIEIDQREAPQIEIHPQEPQLIRIEGQAILSCRATHGIPSPIVSWERVDGRPISLRFKEQYEGTLILSNATMEDAGSYVCRGKNIVGEVSQTTTITIEEPPRLEIRPNVEQLVITEGDELDLSCYGSGSPQPTVEWKTPVPVAMPEYSHNTRGFLPSPQPVAKVQLFRVTQANSGLYTCIGSSSAGTEQRYVQVMVKPKRGDVGPYDDDEDNGYRPQPNPPRPYPQPVPYPSVTPYQVPLHERGVLDCSVTAENVGQIVDWRRVDRRPLPSNTYNSEGRLVIERVEYDAAGQYECYVIQGDRHIPVGVADLVVVELPRIRFQPEMPMVVRSGDFVSILCDASGEQPIDVHWHMDDERLPLPYGVQVQGPNLIFNSITMSEAGRYSCTARNVHGNITKAAEVIVNGREVVDRNPNYNKVEDVSEGETVSLNCLPGPVPHDVDVEWDRTDSPIPVNSHYDGTRLVLPYISRADAGRYVCRIRYPDGATSETYVDVRVKGQNPLPHLKLEHSQSFLRPGDSISVACTSSAGIHIPITWEGVGGSGLPYNFKQVDNHLYISNADTTNAGRYICKATTDDYQTYTAEFELHVDESPMSLEKRPPKVEHAEVRSTVVLRCNSDQYPATFHWSKDQGEISPEQDITSSELRLIEVQASDAGTYVCRATHNGKSTDIPTILVVTGAIPYFPQAPNSYMSFPKMDDVVYKFNFEITFKPERPDGILLYNGQRRGSGDFVALSLNEGFVEFRMDLGKQPIIVKSKEPVKMGEWHTVRVNRVRKDGYMIVDNEEHVPFPGHVRFQSLDLEENLYLGGVPRVEDMAPHSSSPRSGYVGCVSRLILGAREVSLKKDFLHQEGVTSCEPCADDPCANRGVCVESQSMTGYSCVCAKGYTGSTCEALGESCTVGACNSGSCLNTETGMQCLCPANRTGDHCEVYQPLDPERLEFRPHSFAAYKAPRSGKFHVEFSMFPLSNEDGLLAYMAESDRGIGDFASIAIKDKHLEVRFTTLANHLNPLVLRSAEPVEVNKWTDVVAGRRHSEGYLILNNGAEQKARTSGTSKGLSIKTPLYVGGRPNNVEVNRGVAMNGDSFKGRIANLKISSQSVDMVAGLKDSANLRNFQERPAKENLLDSVVDKDYDDCPLGYGGDSCKDVVDLCLATDPCMNGGTCRLVNGGEDTACDCNLGYTGDSCQLTATLLYTAQFKGDGYLELDRSFLSNSSHQNNTEIAMSFSTLQPNGLLLWYGPEKGKAFEGQDFMSVSIRDGHVEFAYRLDGEEEVISQDDVPVDNGGTHIVIIKKNLNMGSLEVDHFTEYGEARPGPRLTSFFPGSIFIGGAPNIAQTTGGRATQGFSGCIHVVEGVVGGAVDLAQMSLSGVNVASCPSDDQLSGTEPPVV